MRIVKQFRENTLALYRLNLNTVSDAENAFLTELESNHLIGSEKAIPYYDRETWNRYLKQYDETRESGKCIQERNRKRRAEEKEKEQLMKQLKMINGSVPNNQQLVMNNEDVTKMFAMFQSQLQQQQVILPALPESGTVTTAAAAPVAAVVMVEEEKVVDGEVEEQAPPVKRVKRGEHQMDRAVIRSPDQDVSDGPTLRRKARKASLDCM